LRERDYSARLLWAVVAVPLVILLVVGSVEKARALLTEGRSGGLVAKQSSVNPEVEMADWVAENVPEGEHMLVVAEPPINGAAVGVARNTYLIFLNDDRYEATQLQLDQPPCSSSPNVPNSCDPEKTSISAIPPDAIWIESTGGCHVLSLSIANLLEQMRQSDADYLMISGSHTFPGILQLSQILQRSNAFELAHFEPAQRSSSKRGVVLLKRTGQEPKTLSTQMTTEVLMSIRRCERAQGPGYQERMKSTFPNGIVTLSRSNPRKG
jgi:hypothetical protein